MINLTVFFKFLKCQYILFTKIENLSRKQFIDLTKTN